MTTQTTPRPSVTSEAVRVGDIVTDPRVQRQILPGRVTSIRKALDLQAIGTLTLSRRDDGENVVLDGQHRVAALVDSGRADFEAHCEVHHGLSIADEAKLFRLLNNTRRATVYDDYLKGVLAGDPECVMVDAIVARHGMHVMNGGRAVGGIHAVGSLRTVHRLRADALDQTLEVLVAAWGPGNHSAFDGHIIVGIGRLLAANHDEIDRPTLIRKLSKHAGGPGALLGAARGLKDIRGGSVGTNVARVVTDIYNKGRRTGALPTA